MTLQKEFNTTPFRVECHFLKGEGRVLKERKIVRDSRGKGKGEGITQKQAREDWGGGEKTLRRGSTAARIPERKRRGLTWKFRN